VMAISVISVSSDSFEDSVGTPAGRVILFGTIPTTIPNTTPVMAISVISVSSDSFEDSVGTPAGRVILFGTIPTTIPNTTPVIAPPTTQTDTTDPSSGHIPPLPAVSPFLSSDDDTTDSDTPDTPPSPTHGTPFTEITTSTQRSPIIPRRRVMILAPGQPIPHGRPYRYHPNRPVYMMTARKRVGPLPVQQLAMRHYVDHSSSDSSSRHSLSDHSSPDLLSTSAGPSRKRRRSPYDICTCITTYVEVGPRETSLRDDVIARDALRDKGIDARVVVKVADRDEIETGVRGPVKVRVERVTHLAMPDDIPEPDQEGAVQGHRIVGVKSTVAALTERVAELKRDNRRLRGTASVESQRVDRLQRGMSRMQREMRQMRRF
nr:hypothetical protein [Tanacetum cinerariifolium]